MEHSAKDINWISSHQQQITYLCYYFIQQTTTTLLQRSTQQDRHQKSTTKTITTRRTITNVNTIIIYIETKTSTIKNFMLALILLIIIYNCFTIIQALINYHTSTSEATHQNKNIISGKPPTQLTNINTNASTTTTPMQSLASTKRYIKNTPIYYHVSVHLRPKQRHQLRTLNRLLQYGRRFRKIDPRQLYYEYTRDYRMERVAHDIRLINDIKDCYHLAPLLSNFNKCHYLASLPFLNTCKLTQLPGIVFSFYKKLFAFLSNQKDTASINPSSVTNGCAQPSNRPSFGRPSTRATRLLNSLDLNPPFAHFAQALLPSRTRAPTGLQSKQTISRNPSTPTDDTDKSAPQPPHQILHSSSLSHAQDTLSVDQQVPTRRLLAPRTNQLQLTPKYNNNSTGTPPLTQVIHEVSICDQPPTLRHSLTLSDSA